MTAYQVWVGLRRFQTRPSNGVCRTYLPMTIVNADSSDAALDLFLSAWFTVKGKRILHLDFEAHEVGFDPRLESEDEKESKRLARAANRGTGE